MSSNAGQVTCIFGTCGGLDHTCARIFHNPSDFSSADCSAAAAASWSSLAVLVRDAGRHNLFVWTTGASESPPQSPAKLQPSIANGITAVAAEGDTLAVLTSDGDVSGSSASISSTVHLINAAEQYAAVRKSIHSPMQLISISCGLAHVLALGSDGNVYAQGSNQYGQCGAAASSRRFETFRSIDTTTTGGGAIQVAAGWNHGAFVTGQHQLFMFGSNAHGQCGVGEQRDVFAPTRVGHWDGLHSDPAEGSIAAVACGGWHSAALSSSGDVYTWGSGHHGQLGRAAGAARVSEVVAVEDALDPHDLQGCCSDVDAAPRVVELNPAAAVQVAHIACGGKHTAAATTTGDLYVWGQACLPAQFVNREQKVLLGLQRFTLKPTALQLRDIWSQCCHTQLINDMASVLPTTELDQGASIRITRLGAGRSCTIVSAVVER